MEITIVVSVAAFLLAATNFLIEFRDRREAAKPSPRTTLVEEQDSVYAVAMSGIARQSTDSYCVLLRSDESALATFSVPGDSEQVRLRETEDRDLRAELEAGQKVMIHTGFDGDLLL